MQRALGLFLVEPLDKDHKIQQLPAASLQKLSVWI